MKVIKDMEYIVDFYFVVVKNILDVFLLILYYKIYNEILIDFEKEII